MLSMYYARSLAGGNILYCCRMSHLKLKRLKSIFKKFGDRLISNKYLSFIDICDYVILYLSKCVFKQSCWRGHWVRKQLKGVYDWYADIVHTIDQIDFLDQKQHNHKNSKYFILKRPSSHTNTFCSRQIPVLNPAEPVSEYEEGL